MATHETRCPRCDSESAPTNNYCFRCGSRLRASEPEPTPAEPWFRAGTIRYAGKLASSALGGVISASIALIIAFLVVAPRDAATDQPVTVSFVTPIPFDEQVGPGPLNASGLVPIDDSRFLLVDDETGNAFFEMSLDQDGAKNAPLLRRTIAGLSPGAVEDLEAATLFERDGERVIIAVSSLEANEDESTDAGLVRVSFGADGTLAGEPMHGFRKWLLRSYPELGRSPGGADDVDMQGLIWDPHRHALLFGVRSATATGHPLVLPVRVDPLAASWSTDALTPMPAIELGLGSADAPQGIRALARHPVTGTFTVILSPAGRHAVPFTLHTWDGGADGNVRHHPHIVFATTMKPEGMTYGTIGGRLAAVVVDDNGGYYVMWQDGGGAV